MEGRGLAEAAHTAGLIILMDAFWQHTVVVCFGHCGDTSRFTHTEELGDMLTKQHVACCWGLRALCCKHLKDDHAMASERNMNERTQCR